MALNITAILADNHIDEQEVEDIRTEIYSEDGDGGAHVTLAELTDLFTLKDSGATYVPAFGDLVVEAAVNYALNDPNTPGVVDADEAAGLNSLIMGDGEVDDVERRILTAIRAQATSVHPTLMG